MFILAHDTVDCNTFMPLPFYPPGLFPFVFPLFLSMLYTQKAPAVSDRSFPLTGYVYEFGNIFFISDIAGEVTNDMVLQNIFQHFCIGK